MRRTIGNPHPAPSDSCIRQQYPIRGNLNYRDGVGRSRRYTIGKHGSPWTCEEARTKAEEVIRGLSAGVDPLVAKAERRTAATVPELVEMYLVEGPAEKPNKKASSWSFETSSLRRHVVPLIGSRAVNSLTAADVSRMQADIAAGITAADIKTGKQGRAIVKGGKAVAGHATAVLSIMLSFAVRRGIASTNPALGVEKLKPQARERFLSVAEVVALADALAALEAEEAINPMMAAAIRLLTLTACRKSEITGLRWHGSTLDDRAFACQTRNQGQGGAARCGGGRAVGEPTENVAFRAAVQQDRRPDRRPAEDVGRCADPGHGSGAV